MKRMNQKENSLRPLSWCVDEHDSNPSACTPDLFQKSSTLGEENYNLSEEKLLGRRENLLMRGMLVRSSSYQALHSALARLYRLDDFTLEKIGQGFFSEVYKARHLVTGKIMVLKMNKLFSNRHNMLREVELMNRLNHPNILTYYGVCVNEGQVHALTQYINGGSLDTLLQNLRIELPWVMRASLTLDIARGMAYLHSKKVFHRDLTSKNILIKQSRDNGKTRLRAVIADFGLAAAIPQDKSVRLRQVGSPYWMAPEVIRGDWYDHRIDIFSFGIVVCEIIARCDADPDILPRTHNFGIHYLAFSRMCQSDCPPCLLEMAFQCCQILPASRPSFKELERLLYCFLTDSRPLQSPRKQKVYHKRSLSDESYSVMRGTAQDASPKDCTVRGAGSPQEVIERISAADPYFQPSSATVNPFSSVKLPAKSQLILQDGGRYCHSMPADLSNNSYVRQSFSISTLAHLTTSDTSLSQAASPTHTPKAPTCDTCNGLLSGLEASPSSNQGGMILDGKSGTCKCSSNLDTDSFRRPFTKASYNRPFPASCLTHESSNHGAVLSPKADISGGGGSLNPHMGIGVTVRRRGSGESGFFSVEDELCLSYSELSSASFLSTEDEDTFGIPPHHPALHRSPSVVTDSSEDLSSLGCGYDLNCDLASISDCDRSGGSHYLSNTESTATDIKSIVEFFERGYGSLRSICEVDRSRQLAANARRRECLVPLLRNRFSHAGCVPYRALGIGGGGAFSKHSNGGGAAHVAQGSTSKCVCAKEKCRFGCGGRRAKERPKIYITEGTVRAKRNIFESK